MLNLKRQHAITVDSLLLTLDKWLQRIPVRLTAVLLFSDARYLEIILIVLIVRIVARLGRWVLERYVSRHSPP